MNQKSRSSPILTQALAVVILLLAAWILLHFLIGIAIAIASVVVFIVALIAVIWAVRVLL